MPIPSTGFLDHADNTEQPSEAVNLPSAHELNYSDGGAGPYQDHSELSVELGTVVLALGDYHIQKEFGFNSDGEFGFNIRLVLNDAYGIILLDYINPPAMEQFVQLGG